MATPSRLNRSRRDQLSRISLDTVAIFVWPDSVTCKQSAPPT